MSKKFEGSCSIVENTKGEIALRKDAKGAFSSANADECYRTMAALSQSEGMDIDRWSLFQPEGGSEPVLLANRYGNPYILLAVPGDDAPSGRRRCRKLA